MKKRKRIMILGANSGQTLAIRKAVELGYYVISADIHHDAPGHAISHEQLFIDISDREEVLRSARRIGIDGITAYWSDMLFPVAAYVAEQMQLPHNPRHTTEIMTHKHLFRQFLSDFGFASPRARGCSDLKEMVEFFDTLHAAAIMKPTDCSGSRGVFKVESVEDIVLHYEESMAYSTEGKLVIEEYLESDIIQQEAEIFVVEGKVVSWGMIEQRRDIVTSAFHPVMHLIPSDISSEIEDKVKETIQRMITALGYVNGPCNIEYLIGRSGEIFILDVGPRNGGNMIPQIVHAATGQDVTAMTLQAAVGDEVTISAARHKPYAMSTAVHSDSDGIFRGLTLAEGLEERLCGSLMLKEEGTVVSTFHNSRDTIGVLAFAFDSREEMNKACEAGKIKVNIE